MFKFLLHTTYTFVSFFYIALEIFEHFIRFSFSVSLSLIRNTWNSNINKWLFSQILSITYSPFRTFTLLAPSFSIVDQSQYNRRDIKVYFNVLSNLTFVTCGILFFSIHKVHIGNRKKYQNFIINLVNSYGKQWNLMKNCITV